MDNSMKPLFEDKYRSYNDKGRDLTFKTEYALKDVMVDINQQNLNIYQAENIMISTIGIMFCELRLTYSSKYNKAKKDEINNKENEVNNNEYIHSTTIK